MKRLILILGICLLVTACTAPGNSLTQTHPQAVVTMPLLAPIYTSSPTATYSLAKSTKTIIQTSTPTLSTTEISSSALNLPIPTMISGAKYQLADWKPEKADQLIETLKKYPDTIPFEQRGYLDSAYYSSFNFAAFAQTEAAFRFPDVVQTTKWRWDSMFNQVQATQNIGEIPIRLILDALNRGEVKITDLGNWFKANAPNMKLEFVAQTPLLDYDSSQIIFVNPVSVSDVGGGTYIWLLRKSSTYTAYSLESPSDFYYVDGEVSADFQDLTGDSIPEIIIHHIDWGSFQMHNGSLDIFDLSRTPPQKLSFDPQPRDTDIAAVTPLKENQNVVGVSLQIPIEIESGGCGRFGPTLNYHWERGSFRLFQIQPPTMDELKSDHRCADMFISWGVNQDNEPASKLMKDLIGSFPFETAEDLQHNNFMIPSQDELRFKFGLYLFYAGDILGAREQMEAIRANSVTSPSAFTKYAKTFLDAYHSKADFLPTCLTTHQCSSYFDVDILASFIPSSRFSEIINLLKQMGVPVQVSGSYDFDSDGQKEYFLITDSGVDNFWIFSLSANEIKSSAFNFFFSDNIKNVQITFLRYEQNMPIFRATNRDNKDESLIFYYDQDSLQESISEDDADQRVEKIAHDLLSGLMTPQTATTQLIELQNTQILCTHVSDEWCFPNARFEYILGLSHELSNDDHLAIEIYQHIWNTYPQSPYAIMAMSKLEITP